MESVTPPVDGTRSVERRSVAEMIGEALREAGVLFGVFMPLDLALQGRRLTLQWALVVLILPTALITVGLIVERRRTQ